MDVKNIKQTLLALGYFPHNGMYLKNFGGCIFQYDDGWWNGRPCILQVFFHNLTSGGWEKEVMRASPVENPSAEGIMWAEMAALSDRVINPKYVPHNACDALLESYGI